MRLGITNRAATVLLLCILTSCAGYSIERDGQGCGYDVYAPAPYLLGTPTVDQATSTLYYTFSVVYLPDYSRRYRVHSWAGLGKADFVFQFTDGWMLTSIEDKSSNEKVLDALAGLAKQVLPTDPWKAITPGADAGPLREYSMRPVLYRIEFDQSGCPIGIRELGDTNQMCPQLRCASPSDR